LELEVPTTVTTTTDGVLMGIDEEALAEERDFRFARRAHRIGPDPTLDRRIKALYLDRTVWDSRRCGEELGIGTHRIFELRGGRAATRREPPHPAAFPTMDVVLGYVAGVPSPGVEAGRVREWAVQRGTHMLDPATGKLVKKESLRHGRSRSGRLTMGQQHVPGQTRKGKRKKDTDK
jgi:hypothetical protein